MLIEPKKLPATGEIVSIKLMNGDEIVGKMGRLRDDGIELIKPVGIAVHMVGPQQAQIGLAPFMASIDDDGATLFLKSALVCEPVVTRKDVASTYLKATTGIEMPTSRNTSGLVGL